MATIQMYYKNSSGYQLYYPQTDMVSVINLNTTINGINSTISSNYNTLNNKFNNYYTKTETLSSTTATSYGQAASANPDAVFQTLNTQSYPQVGDIKITARTDLDDSWILCNGDLILNNQPELVEMFKMDETDNWNKLITDYNIGDLVEASVNVYGDSCRFYNNQYVFLARSTHEIVGEYKHYFITLSQDLKNFNYYEISGIDGSEIYANSYWNIYNNQIILFQIDSRYNIFNIYVGNSLQGVFTKYQYTGFEDGWSAFDEACMSDSGYILVPTFPVSYNSYYREYTYSVGIVYTNEFGNLTLSEKILGSTTSDETSITRIYTNIILKYGNGYYVMYICNAETNQDYIYYTTNPSGTWTKKMYSGGVAPTTKLGKLFYDEYDDAWIITGTASDGYYYVKGSPGGNWQKVSTLINPLYFYTFNGQGYFSNTYFYKIQDITTGSFQQLGVITEDNVTETLMTPIFMDNSGNLVEFNFWKGSQPFENMQAYVLGSILPTITLDKVYAYIKGS